MTDGTEPEKKTDGEETADKASDGDASAEGASKGETLSEETPASEAKTGPEDTSDQKEVAETAATEAKSEEASESTLSEEDDEMTHAADEPTAMWGVNALKELGLDVAPEEESRPATEGTGRHKAIGVDFSDGAAPVTTPKKHSNAVWIGLVLVLLGAAIAVAAVRFM